MTSRGLIKNENVGVKGHSFRVMLPHLFRRFKVEPFVGVTVKRPDVDSMLSISISEPKEELLTVYYGED